MTARIGARNENVTVDRVRELFSYDPENGEMVYKIDAFRVKARTVVNVLKREITVEGVRHQLADIVWLHYYGVWPTNCVDHENRRINDISINNLRKATHSQNQYNKVSPNSHGYKGVTWRNRAQNPWLAKIRVDGKRINLGSFPTKELAAKAYAEACLKYHGEFANLEVK